MAMSNVFIPSYIYNEPIESLNLHARIANSLKRYGIKKVGEVLERDGDALLVLRNIGEKALQEISDCLTEKGWLPEPIMDM